MRFIKPTTSVNVEKSFEVSTGHGSVIQKGNVTKDNIYALQLWNNQEEIRVYRGSINDPKNLNILKFKGNGAAGHHTQTWEYSGKKNNWFIGTKPVGSWCSQIARVDIVSDGVNHNSNLDFARIAWLSHAGKMDYPGDDMVRSEAAVSPNYEKLLIATIDKAGTGYFSIYKLSLINKALDNVKNLSPEKRYIKINDLEYALDSSFKVTEFYNKNADKYDNFVLNSVQGYDLDNYGNIYVTSQKSPDIDKRTGKFEAHHKQILKIPAYARNDSSRWSTLDLSAAGVIDIKGKGLHSEVESIQIIDENYGYLTVAYHESRGTKPKCYSYTSKNMIYKIKWSD
ncbi:helveticin J family class III bacteriocin [Lactobacillus sp. PSON]|uniref:helveticin J family class III bacteriocin n=1 Tax=Lactobacillus sp. PSON TaxID=3455454 RepID=UPI004041FCC1